MIAPIESGSTGVEIRPHSVGLRRFYYVAIALVTSVGVFLFILSESTDTLFAWTIEPPLTAAFLGANYFAAFFLAFFSAREAIWANARLTYAVSVVFITLTGLATFMHLDKFEFDHLNAWLWVFVYGAVPPLLVFLGMRELRLPGDDPPRTAPVERWLLPVAGVLATIVLFLGIALFVSPSSADSLWPWPLTPLTSRAVAAWLLALAAGLIVLIWERDWGRVGVAGLTFTALPILQVVALVRFSDTVDWDGAAVWLYVAYLAGLLALGVFGLVRSLSASRAQSPLASAPTAGS